MGVQQFDAVIVGFRRHRGSDPVAGVELLH